MQIQTKPEQIKYAPPAAEGYNYTLGSWAIEEKDGKATALASPGLFGTWPMVDFCRGYAYLVFVKSFLGEERAEEHIKLKGEFVIIPGGKPATVLFDAPVVKQFIPVKFY